MTCFGTAGVVKRCLTVDETFFGTRSETEYCGSMIIHLVEVDFLDISN